MCSCYCLIIILLVLHLMTLLLILLLLLLLMRQEDKSGTHRKCSLQTRMKIIHQKSIQDYNKGDIDAILGEAPEFYSDRGIDAFLGNALEFENDTVVAEDSVPNDNNEIGYRRNCACR